MGSGCQLPDTGEGRKVGGKETSICQAQDEVSQQTGGTVHHVMSYTPYLVSHMLHVIVIHALESSNKNKLVWMTSSFFTVEIKGLFHTNLDFCQKARENTGRPANFHKQPLKQYLKCVEKEFNVQIPLLIS